MTVRDRGLDCSSNLCVVVCCLCDALGNSKMDCQFVY